MPLSVDVKLPRGHEPRFPSRCVCCGQDPDGGLVSVKTHTVGGRALLGWPFGGAFTARVPACAPCGSGLRWRRRGGTVLTLLLTLTVLFFAWPQLEGVVARSLRKWLMLALALFCLSPQLLWSTFKPPVFDLMAFPESVDYEFRDPEYAAELVRLNSDAEWVEVT